jgi:CRP/FNR family transcriptional regulator
MRKNYFVILFKKIQIVPKNCQMKTKSLLIDRVIKNIPFFACLSEEEIKKFRHVLIEKKFPKNKIIFMEEDTQNYMYVITSGKVKVVHQEFDGKEHIVAVHKTGDFFGEMALLDGKTAPATVIAMEDVDMLIMSKRDFEEYLLNNNKALKEIISILCLRLRQAWMMNKALRKSNAEDKLRALLKLMGMHYGIKDQRGTLITLKLTHQDIADYLAISRETVTRLLNKLVRDGEIEVLDDKNLLLKPAF